MSDIRATWFCIDIECSGPVPAIFDMISLGAVAVHDSASGHLRLGDTFYVELRPQGPKIDPGAMKVNGLDIQALMRDGLPRRDAMSNLSAWVERVKDPDTEAVFVGHNAPFDWSFVAWCYAAEGMANPFGYKALDTKALSAGILNLHWLDSSKEILADRLALPAEDMGQKHRADYDAQYQALILKALLERQRGL
jgi:DNA polymerase III alpha subunit (gram-positive type)